LYPERLIAFCCVDPRMPGCTKQIDIFVKYYGCRGFGEHINSLAFADPRNKAIYAKCDEYGLPLVFELNRDYCYDDIHLSQLEACLKEFPNVTFCGHGPGFWAAISADYDAQGGYPRGPVVPGGPVDRLLEEYDNLYADISAPSGYNALTRDPEFTQGFVARHWRKLLYGSDVMGPHWDIPQLRWLAELEVSPEIRQAIASGNARRVLRLDQQPRGR
jgi:predicted TIM-barrel fold metal-dependent hydrolase